MSGSALKSALGTAATWVFLALAGYLSLNHVTEIRQTGYWLLGIDPEATAAALHTPITHAPEMEPARPDAPTGSVILDANRHGHFITSVAMNGRDIEVVVDTGASFVALTYEDAGRAGIFVSPADFTHKVNTANGIARIAPVTIDSISIGDIQIRNVRGAVCEPGRLRTSLLGNSFLSRLKRWEMRDGKLALEQ
ncbi:MAG: TIGR02281 family clan AA aspartic protease [Hyphomicrobiaceae bacterium]